jgi:hypothetical protein
MVGEPLKYSPSEAAPFMADGVRAEAQTERVWSYLTRRFTANASLQG